MKQTTARIINSISYWLHTHAVHIGFFVFAFMLPVLSFAIPETHIALDQNNIDAKHTIWVVGDHKIVAQAFRACAAFFASGGMWGIIKVATLFAFIAMTLTIITKRNMQAFNYFVMFVLMCCAFLIKTPVVVASYFDGQSGGTGTGATKFETVEGVPIGVAWPLIIFSNIAKTFTEKYDTEMQSIPSVGNGVSPQQQGGILIHGTEGFFSPLKASLRLRSTASLGAEDELIFKNLYNNMVVCNWGEKVRDLGDEVGAIRAIASRGQSGAVATLYYITPDDLKAGNHNLQVKQTTCPAVGQYIALKMLLNIHNKNNSTHSVKAEKSANSKMGTVTLPNQTKDQDPAQRANNWTELFFKNQANRVQDEIDSFPNQLAGAFSKGTLIDRSANGNTRVEDIYTAMNKAIGIKWGDDRETVPTEITKVMPVIDPLHTYQSMNGVAQQNLMDNRIAADEIEAHIVYNHIISNCVSMSPTDCNRYILAMTNARNKAIIDTTGEASMFQHYMHYAMNILMFIYVVMTPVIVVVIFAMGLSGWRLASAYLLFAVWINSWLPLDAAIAYYMQQSYLDRIGDLALALDGAGRGYKLFSLGTMNAILDGAQDTIASAATFMSMVPIIMLSLLSGSIYGLVQVAQRAGMTGKDYVDETKIAADLEASQVTGVARMLERNAQMSPTGYVSSTQMANGGMLGNAAFTDKKMLHFRTSDEIREAHNHINSATLSMSDSKQISRTVAHAKSDGIVTSDGWVYVKDQNGGHTWQEVHTGDDLKQFAKQNQAVAAIVENEHHLGADLNKGSKGDNYGVGDMVGDTFKYGYDTVGKTAGGFGLWTSSTDESATHQSSEASSRNISSTLSNSDGVSFSMSEKFDENSSLMTNLSRAEREEVSQTFAQNLSHTNTDTAAISKAITETYSTSSDASFQATTLLSDTNLSQRNIAETQQIFGNSADSAAKYSTKVADEIRLAQQGGNWGDSGNAIQDVNRVLLKYADSDNINEQLAAKAAISNIFNTEGVSANANGDALGEVTAKELELTEKNNEFKRTQDVSVFTRPVSVDNVDKSVGQFEKEMDYDKSKQEFDTQTSQTMVEKHADLIQKQSKINAQGQEVVGSTQQALNDRDLQANQHVRGYERLLDKQLRPWEVWSEQWGLTPEQAEEMRQSRMQMDRIIEKNARNLDDLIGGSVSPAVYHSTPNDGINLMTDSGERIPVDNAHSGNLNGTTVQATEQSLSQAVPSVKQEAIHSEQPATTTTPLHNEPQTAVAEETAQINQAEVKQAEIQHAETNSTPIQQNMAENAQDNGISGNLKDEKQAEVVDKPATETAHSTAQAAPQRVEVNQVENADSTALNNAQDAQQTQAAMADNHADGQAGKSADTGNTGEEKGEENAQTAVETAENAQPAADMPEQTAPQTAPQNAPRFEVPEYLRQPELQPSEKIEPKQADTAEQVDKSVIEQANNEENELQNQADKAEQVAKQNTQAENERLKEQANDEENERQRQADEQERQERLLAQQKAEKEAEAEQRRLAEQKAEEERKAEEQRRAEEEKARLEREKAEKEAEQKRIEAEKAQEQATLDAMNKKLTPQTDAWAFTDPDKLKELQEQGLVDKPVVGQQSTSKSQKLYRSKNFTDEKAEIIKESAKQLGVKPNDLAQVISFETVGTFSPNARNPKSSATGLIQFMGKGKNHDTYFGMTRDQFGSLSFKEQMKYVEKYFKDRGFSADKPRDIADLYTAVTGSGYKKGSREYELNKVWDANKNGVIEKGEMVQAPEFKAHKRKYFDE